MSFRRLVMGVSLMAIFAMAVHVSADTDTWWHLRAGEWMVQHRQLLTTDPFSLTRMGQAWIYPGWLAQIVLYAVYQGLGFAGLNLLTGGMVLLAFATLWPVLEAAPLVRGFVLVLGAAASGIFWSARPQIFTLALAGVFVALLERLRRDEAKQWWWLPLLMVLWVNLHGGFAVGLMLIGVYVAGELLDIALGPFRGQSWLKGWTDRRRVLVRLLLAGAASVVAVAVNPDGPRMLLYPFQTVAIGVLRQYIQEWQSPNFHLLEMQPFLWMLLFTLVALALSKRSVHPTGLLAVSIFGFLAFEAARNIGIFALVSVPVLARHGESALQPVTDRLGGGKQVPERLARGVNLVLFCLVALGAMVRVASQLPLSVNLAGIERLEPVKAVDFIEAEQPTGPLFNSYNWGGYVLWRLYPDYRSFVDGRTDLFDDQLLRAYLAAWQGGSDWQSLFRQWDIKLVLIEPQSPLATVLQAAGWVAIYQDPTAIVLVPAPG